MNTIKHTTIEELEGSESCCLYFFNFIFLLPVITFCCGFYSVEPNETMILEVFGKPIKKIEDSGLHWYFPLFVSKKLVSNAL